MMLGGCAINFCPVKKHLSRLKVYTGRNFEATILQFFPFGSLFIPPLFLAVYFFNSKILCFVRGLYFNVKKFKFFPQFYLK